MRTTHLQLTAVMADLMRADPGLPMPGFAIGAAMWAPPSASWSSRASPRCRSARPSCYTRRVAGPGDRVRPARPTPAGGSAGASLRLNQGVTAYHGIVDIAEVTPEDVVFVSGAAGGVGSMAGQIAKALGARMVIGSAGSAAKVAYLTKELGFDAAINYRDGEIAAQLRALAPEGITVFYDTIGGATFEAAVQAAAHGARFALCGALAGQLDDSVGAHPRLDVMTAIVKELVIKPFSTRHSPEQIQAWHAHYGRWLAEGKIVYSGTVLAGGIDAAPRVLDELLAGRHRGNVILRITG